MHALDSIIVIACAVPRTEIVVFQAYTTSLSKVTEEADSDSGDEEDHAQEEVSDTEQCALGQEEANYAEGKAFPMQHRCLLPTEWRTNNFFESVLTTPHDISQALQKPSGAGLDFGYLLMLSLNTQLQQKVVDVVVGGEEDEQWEPVAATALPAEVQRFRDILSREITNRWYGCFPSRLFCFVLFSLFSLLFSDLFRCANSPTA